MTFTSNGFTGYTLGSEKSAYWELAAGGIRLKTTRDKMIPLFIFKNTAEAKKARDELTRLIDLLETDE